MSQSKNLREARRWFLTAEEDLRAAEVLRDTGHYARACFLAQQSAEKALKAVWVGCRSAPRLASEWVADRPALSPVGSDSREHPRVSRFPRRSLKPALCARCSHRFEPAVRS